MKPICIKCMRSQYGNYNLKCVDDILSALDTDRRDENVYINPIHIVDVRFEEVDSEYGCYRPIGKYFVIRTILDDRYFVRISRWKQFYKDLTGEDYVENKIE